MNITKSGVSAAALVAALAAQSTEASVADPASVPGRHHARAPEPRPPQHAPSAADDRPNIVLVLVDDMRTDELTFLADTKRLMNRQGVFFRNAISPHPLCCPARAELVSGQYGSNNGVRHNNGRFGGLRALRHRADTVPAWLYDSGYQTGYLGKYLNAYQNSREHGWTTWQPLVTAMVSRYTSYQFRGKRKVTKGYVTHAIERKTNRMVRDFSGAGRPFFLVVNHTAPHARTMGNDQDPPVPSRRYRNYPVTTRDLGYFLDKPSFNKRHLTDVPPSLEQPRLGDRTYIDDAIGRIRALQSVDDAMESLVAVLAERRELDHTYIVFASDNGYLLGEHRLTRKNHLVRESLDVPIVVRGPGVERRAVSRRIVSLVDLPRTFLDIAGVAPRRPVDGASILPLLRRPGGPWRDTTLVQTGDENGWALRGVQTPRYLYAMDVRSHGHNYLFDRRRDPYERRNVIGADRYRRVVKELRRRYYALADCSGRNCNRVFGGDPSPR
ncbi:MAG: sulfatase-like hydrolase/transferase [Nocardioides sp.]